MINGIIGLGVLLGVFFCPVLIFFVIMAICERDEDTKDCPDIILGENGHWYNGKYFPAETNSEKLDKIINYYKGD